MLFPWPNHQVSGISFVSRIYIRLLQLVFPLLLLRTYVLTALVSVATAEVMNIMEKVTTISIVRTCVSEPVGDVIRTCFIGSRSTQSVNAAEIAPLSCAATYSGTCRMCKKKKYNK